MMSASGLYCALIHYFWTVPPDIKKKSYWHRTLLRNQTINPVAMRQPHQTDNLLSWCILQCCGPALASDHRPHSLPHPSGSGRRPSSASVWRPPGEGRGYFWQAESWDGKKTNISAQWCGMTAHRLLKLLKWYYWEAAHLSHTHTHTHTHTLSCASSNRQVMVSLKQGNILSLPFTQG